VVIGKMVREEGAWVICVCISYMGDGSQIGSAVLWMHISNGETQKYNFGVKTSWED